MSDTLDHVLEQTGVVMEVIVIDDGSTDETGTVLERYERCETRVRIISQDNQGITQALIRGCHEASGELVARHDVGDRSEPERLKKQANILKRCPDTAFVSSWVRYIGPRDESAGCIQHDPTQADLTLSIRNERQKRVRGPYHGSTMFRKSEYDTVGGYRPQFYFAQDVDLWLRLHEIGHHHIVPEMLYTARIDPESISGRYRAEQDHCLELAVAAARARRASCSEEPYLEEAAQVFPPPNGQRTANRRRRARSFYFMGCLLADESPNAAREYFFKSISTYPFSAKGWIRLAYSMLNSVRARSDAH